MNLLEYVKMPTPCRHIAEEHSPPEILGRCGETVSVVHAACRVHGQCRARSVMLQKEKVALETSLASMGARRVLPGADRAVFLKCLLRCIAKTPAIR